MGLESLLTRPPYPETVCITFFLTAQLSVSMVFCGPPLPLASHFLCGPVRVGAENKMEGKRKLIAAGGRRIASLYLVAPPQVSPGYTTNSSFCRRTTSVR